MKLFRLFRIKGSYGVIGVGGLMISTEIQKISTHIEDLRGS